MWKFGWVAYAWWITAQPRTRSSRRAQTQHWMFEEMCSVSLEYCDCEKAVWCTCWHLAAIIMLVSFLSFFRFMEGPIHTDTRLHYQKHPVLSRKEHHVGECPDWWAECCYWYVTSIRSTSSSPHSNMHLSAGPPHVYKIVHTECKDFLVPPNAPVARNGCHLGVTEEAARICSKIAL